MKSLVRAALAASLVLPGGVRAGDISGPRRGAELMNTPVTVTTRKERALRDAPGVVTVITREDIIASGAHDLVDVLELVPGLQFGVDVEGALGPSVRGLWGTEGKVLLLVDGLEMNERLYGTNQYQFSMPVDLIERIEIIRGPGSVVYGGFAELAVIQITTLRGATLGGLELHGLGSMMDTQPGRVGAAAAWGRAFEDELELSVAAYGAYGSVSPATYGPSENGHRASLADTRQDARWVNAGATWRGLSLRLLLDAPTRESLDGYGEPLDHPARLGFTGYFGEIAYRAPVSERVQLVPRFAWKRQQPWRSGDKSLPTYYEKTADKYHGALTLDAAVIEDLDLQAAVEVVHDRARLDDPEEVGTQRLFDGRETLSVTNGAGYVQAVWNPEVVTLVAGLRGEWSQRYTGTVVPRLGAIWSRDRFYVKGLVSEAFRTPALENIGLPHAASIDPERTMVYEGEVGFQIPYAFALGLNVFEMRLRDPIIFTYAQASGEEEYRNAEDTGTRGLEVVQRAMGVWGRTELSYSLYSAESMNRVAEYAVPVEDSALLGAAQHKVAFRGVFRLPGRVTLGPSAVFLSERYAVAGHYPGASSAAGWAGSGEPRVRLEPPTLRLNLFTSWTPPGLDTLYVGAGVYDLTDSGHRAVQPHDSGHAPLPGAGREWLLKVGYALPLGEETPPEP